MITEPETERDRIAEVRAAIRQPNMMALSRLVHDAQQDTHPLADAAGSTGPYVVQGCVVYGAQQLNDAVLTIWKTVPALLDELERLRAELEVRATPAVQPGNTIVVNIDPPRSNTDEAFAAGRAAVLREIRRRGGSLR
jgi:hypothetical protein